MKQPRMREFKKGRDQRRPGGKAGESHHARDKRASHYSAKPDGARDKRAPHPGATPKGARDKRGGHPGIARPEQNWQDRKRPDLKRQDQQRPDLKRQDGKRPYESRREHIAPLPVKTPRPRFKKAGRSVPRDPNGPVMLYGWHTVKAALQNPARKFRSLMLTENAQRRLAEDGVAFPIAPATVKPEDIAAIVGPEAVHQGLYAETDPLPAPDLLDLPQRGIMLVLDQITDPHNVGAIMRSAAAFGVTAVITTERHSPEATGVLAKAASGALDHVPIVTVPISRARCRRSRTISFSWWDWIRKPTPISPPCRCRLRSPWCSAPKAKACGN